MRFLLVTSPLGRLLVTLGLRGPIGLKLLVVHSLIGFIFILIGLTGICIHLLPQSTHDLTHLLKRGTFILLHDLLAVGLYKPHISAKWTAGAVMDLLVKTKALRYVRRKGGSHLLIELLLEPLLRTMLNLRAMNLYGLGDKVILMLLENLGVHDFWFRL